MGLRGPKLPPNPTFLQREAQQRNARAEVKAHARVLLLARKSTPEGWIKYALSSCKQRAKMLNVPYSLKPSDLTVPNECPALGIPIILGQDQGYAGKDNSPSVDRLVPSKGYVKDNVRVISTRANFLKNNATIEELEGILHYMKAEI